MITEIETIDLDKAREYLATNPLFESGKKGTNRPLSVKVVNNYAKEMLYGNWMLTHQGIAFDTKGKLRDGQHRLEAIIQAATEGAIDGEFKLDPNPNIYIETEVTRGVDPKTFDVIDVGRGRTASQILAMSGYINTILLASAGRLLYLFENHEYVQWRSIKVSSHTVLETVAKNKLENYTSIGTSLFEVGFINSAVMVGYYVCHRAYPDGPHNEFLEALKTGEDLKSEDPRLVLRNYMIRSKRDADNRRDTYVHLALYIKSWNDFVNGRRRSQLTWRANESFPKPVNGPNGGGNGS